MFCGYKGSTKKEMNMTKVILKKIRKEMPVILPPGAKGEIAKALGCGRATVWAALVNNRGDRLQTRSGRMCWRSTEEWLRKKR